MKRTLASALVLLPASASAHEVAHQVGHLHPHGLTYAFIAVVLGAVAWRFLFRS